MAVWQQSWKLCKAKYWGSIAQKVEVAAECWKGVDISQWQFVANKPSDLPQQENSWDCGVFTCLYARRLVTGGTMVSDQQSIPQFRKHMILELHSQTLLDPSPSNIEKDIYCAVDYVNNYFIG